jgi:hypothetical protein
LAANSRRVLLTSTLINDVTRARAGHLEVISVAGPETHSPEPEMKMDPAQLYREETYTDRSAGTLRVLTPVKPDGSADPDRATVYVGQAQLYTPMGAVPLAFEIAAGSLREAVEKFGDAVKDAVEQAIEEAKQLRREAASQIVIPEAGPGIGAPGGLPGGKIKLP